MKQRILFVDDEAFVLEGLQRMLRHFRGEWEMVFAESGSKALELMGQTPFDVIVSDMRMPGMNGAELLAEVMKRYPKTIRLILSGHADQALILKCVGSTHQYLSKPCEPEMLKATILRAAGVGNSLQDQKLRQLVAQMDRLPSIPSLYMQIVEKLHDPEVMLEQIGELIGRDLGMTAKIMKLANSAFFGLRREISSASEAVNYIGLETIKSLVLAINAFSQFENVKLGGFSIEKLWSHSQETAAAAKQIAQAEQADRKMTDETFVAGLLHDTGKLVLASNFPDQYNKIVEAQLSSADRLMAEEQAFGANHAAVGGYLLGLWALPVPIVEAIAFHHCPAKSLNKAFSPLTAVHSANALVHAQLQQSRQGSNQSEEDEHYLGELGLQEHFAAWGSAMRNSLQPELIN